MKFLITSGKKKGFSFEVQDSEVTLGRKSDNTVVLDDENASGRHAKIFMDGHEVVVEDCDSVNGITVNGKSATKATLSTGDVIGIGNTQITVQEDEEEDLPRHSKKEEKKTAKKGGLAKNLMAIILLVAVAGAGYLVLTKKRGGGNALLGSVNPTEYTDKVFQLRYEKARASAENIFRYEFRIEDKTLFILIDDLKQSRQVRRDKVLQPAQVESIQNFLHDQKIFSIASQEGISKDSWDCDLIRVVSRGQHFQVKILNRVLPEDLARITSYLESFGEAELGLVAATMPLEELKKRAQDAFLRGKKLYEEKFVTVGNLYNAIKAYSEVIWYLDTVEPKPKIYGDAIHQKQMATEELDKQLKDHNFSASKAVNMKEWKKARLEYSMILQKMPDTSDPRHQDARTRLLDVEKRVQSK